jgi:zinc/manganese transport system substrate-binding protein
VRSRVVAVLTVVTAVALSACGAPSSVSPEGSGGQGGGRSGRVLQVVAAENVWGSVAAQVGGAHVEVTSLIDNPDADPHDYEPTTADARAVASADLVLINGAGYDAWAEKLVAASPAASRTDLVVSDLLRVPDGGNPHRWYNPGDVARVVDQLAADFAKADPVHAAAFEAQRSAFRNSGLAEYTKVIAEIRARYAGTPVGASESILAMVTPALGLDLVTPPTFLKAVSEGTDPSVADTTTVHQQISGKRIKVYVVNSQNATPDVQAQVDAARAAGIPVTAITETMVPPTARWQDWQTRQLVALRDALREATGR